MKYLKYGGMNVYCDDSLNIFTLQRKTDQRQNQIGSNSKRQDSIKDSIWSRGETI